MADTNDIRAPATVPAPTQRALADVAALDRQLTQVRQQNLRKQRQRQQELRAFRRAARHTAYLFFALLFIAAGIADLASIVKDVVEAIPVVGWILGVAASVFTAVCVGVPIYFAQRRVKKMNDETARIATANQRLRGELDAQFLRLRPRMVESGQQAVVRRTDPATLGPSAFSVYKARIVLNIAIVQILEAIPIVDLGPWQIAKVVQVFIHQQREFRQARAQILAYQMLDRRLGLLEQFEREYLEAMLSATVLRIVAEEEEQRRLETPRYDEPSSRIADVIPAS